MTTAEGAKTAGFDTDVSEIDVAIDHVRDHVADGTRAQSVGGGDHREQIRAVRFEKMGRLIDGNILVRKRTIQNLCSGFGNARQQMFERRFELAIHDATVARSGRKLNAGESRAERKARAARGSR